MVAPNRQPEFPPAHYILVVGGGNGEYILQLEESLEIGQKNLVDSRFLIGGGGVNQTMRLLRAGYAPLPILPLGHDELGQKIQYELRQEYQASDLTRTVADYIGADNFLIFDLKTRLSTIVIHGGERTIFTEKMTGLENFYPHLVERLEELDERLGGCIKAIAIGDIPADAPGVHPTGAGRCTQYLLERFSGRCPIFINPGKSQLRLAPSDWQDYLRRLDIIQLNITEARELFCHLHAISHPSLSQLLDWFYQSQIKAAITCDRYGVLGIYPKEPEKMIFVPPLNLAQTVDTTGAGDAFGAGLLSRLYGSEDFSFEDFSEALNEARVWAAYACTHVGGSADCPTRQELEEFKQSRLEVSEGVEIFTRQAIQPILKILEKIYSF